MPEIELQRLAQIYEQRGLKKETALVVAQELTAFDALGAHVRDELGINEISRANPIQAALASGAAFLAGGAMPLIGVIALPPQNTEYYLYGMAILFLSVLGGVAAKTGGSNVVNAIVRVSFWGTIAMVLTAIVGYLFGVNI